MSKKDNSGVIILGCPRSGTTLLRRLLEGHDSFACPGETGLFRTAANYLTTETTAVGVDMGVVSGLRHMDIDHDVLLSRLRDFTESFLTDYAASKGKPRWVEKDAFNAFHINNISEIFGNSVKYVCIVRHGLDTAISMKELCDKSGSYLLDLHEYIQKDKRPLGALCRAWVDVCTEIHTLVQNHSDHALVVRYEDLVTNPETEMRRVLEFLDESFEEDLIATALDSVGSLGLSDWKAFEKHTIDTSSIGRWKKLTKFEKNYLASIANSALNLFGYDPIEKSKTPDSIEAQRRYEMGLLLARARGQGSVE